MTNEYLFFALCAFIGFVVQSLFKLSGLQKDANAAKLDFDWKRDYVKKDYFSILLSAISPAVWLALYDEWVAKYQYLEAWLNTSFFVFGAIGSYIIQYFLGSAKESIRKTINSKIDE